MKMISPLFISLAMLPLLGARPDASGKPAADAKATADATVAYGALHFPPNPRLLFGPAGIDAFKLKVLRPQWLPIWDDFIKQLDGKLAAAVDLPPRGGNWSHNYVCPTHGVKLKGGKRIGHWQWEHICSVGDHILRGDPSRGTSDFDGCVIEQTHKKLAHEVCSLGLAFQVTGDARYAERAKAILLAYAGIYRTYPYHNKDGTLTGGKKGGWEGRAFTQPLSEASWLIELVQGADFVWNHMNEQERRACGDGLFRAAVDDVIIKAHLGIQNMQCYCDSAIGLTGFLLQDERLIRKAIEDPKLGFQQQITQGVTADGSWLEGAWGYHFFAIEGMLPLLEASRLCGIDLFSRYQESFKRMFDAPLALATPLLTLPAFNDSSGVTIANYVDLYEFAYARLQQPVYAALLRESDRHGKLALWYGVDELPTGEIPALGSRNAVNAGYAILEKGAGANATWLCLKYGPHGGMHGHPDKLTFVLYFRGKLIAADAGSRPYGSPLHADWDLTTFGHNTLLVDEESQAKATGSCIAFGSMNGIDYVVADAGPIYPGVKFTRTLCLLNDKLLVVCDQVRSTDEHIYDIVYHQRGTWDGLAPGTAWNPSDKNGYKYLADATVRPAEAGFTAALSLEPELRTTVTVLGNAPTDIITATGIGANSIDRVPVAVFRRKARNTAFVWAISLTREAPTIELRPVQNAKGAAVGSEQAVALVVRWGGQVYRVLTNPEKISINAAFDDGDLRTEAPLTAK